MKKLLMITGAIALSATLTNCTAKTDEASGSERLTTAAVMKTGLGSAVDTIQGVGGAMGSNGTFGANSVGTMSAATKCTEHAQPGSDTNASGTVTDGQNSTPNELLSQSDTKYALQQLYCILATETSSPEAVAGAVESFKSIICAVEKQLGTLPFNGVPVAITGLTLDTTCFDADAITDMNGGVPATSTTLTIPGGATVTSSLNPTFSEIPGNTHYSHGIKIASNTSGLLTYIIVAKFPTSVTSDPIESGDFEFATLGTGSMMQGTGIEYTAGKLYGTGTTKHMWYESRINRIKSGINDPICQPGSASSSCGFARHIRISTDIAFTGGDISNVSNMSAIITDSGDSTGSGNSNQMKVITATGSLTTGLTGKIYSNSNSPVTLTGSSTLANTFTGGDIGVTSCIIGSGSAPSTSCGSAPAPLAPTSAINTFFLPANTSTWLANSSTKGGLGFTGAVTFADEQFVSP